MKIYILERDNFEERPDPQVFMDGNVAYETVRKEFRSKLTELGISDEFSEYEIDEENGYSHCWFIDNSSHCGDCMISDVHGSDEWSWRITEHDIPNGSEEEKPWYVEKWYDDDLIGALEYRVIEPTDENIEKLRDACKGIFDDKSDRNEMIDVMVYELFGESQYSVKYEDNIGGEDRIESYSTEEEAEKAIEEDLESCKEWMQSKGYDYADFGNKTEIWVPGGDEYASWERLWK